MESVTSKESIDQKFAKIEKLLEDYRSSVYRNDYKGIATEVVNSRLIE